MEQNKRHTFEIKDEFYLDGKPFQIISGGIHYFRVLPEYWEDRLRKLKALGCNTVETYVPWNMHEPKKGEFDFVGERWHGMLDLKRFVETAQKIGLWVILRPSPYICAEWDFGGFPAWLLSEGEMELRTSDERYLRHVRDYYQVLMPYLAPMQVTQGGPVPVSYTHLDVYKRQDLYRWKAVPRYRGKTGFGRTAVYRGVSL